MNKLYDRDLSWLSFNYRVLMEAMDASLPTLERLRFIAIYSSNLDEFFRVRVASLLRLQAIGPHKIHDQLTFDPGQVINQIHQTLNQHLQIYGESLQIVLGLLKKQGIHIHQCTLEAAHLPELESYFKTRILAYLQPQFISKKKAPFLKNRSLYLAVHLRGKQKDKIAILNIPSDEMPRFQVVRDASGIHYYFIDDIIRHMLPHLFPGYEVIECRSIKLNKDADLQIDDEFHGDLVEKIEKQVQKRDLGQPCRFLYEGSCSAPLLAALCEHLGLAQEDLSAGGTHHNLNDFFQIKSHNIPELEYAPMPPVQNRQLEAAGIFHAIDQQDQILHFPYHSYDYVLRFFNEAAIHPHVKEINVTFYRMAEDSLIGHALVSAAKNGKKVNVFMEVKARFDEENNLRWAQQMREAGIHVQYSLPGLKVHAKVALIRMKKGSETRFYGFFGTGNLNENTARIYGDHGLLTCHPEMTRELHQVFRFLVHGHTPEPFQQLIVSQFGAPECFINLIDQEIRIAQTGKEARIIIKLNNLEEPVMIGKLYEAAEAGVKVQVIARSICCLVPGTAGISVSRIVDRYLEHARMFYFHNSGEPKIYLGSSDWMNRNLHHRIEVTFPIYEASIREQLLHILQLQLQDNTNRVLLSAELENLPLAPDPAAPVINAQRDTYAYIARIHQKTAPG